MFSVCHLTSVHKRDDTRIFVKQCSSLAESGYGVSLVVADGKGDDFLNGVRIMDVGKPSSRLERFWKKGSAIYRAARNIDADLYHFHDPELFFVGLALKLKGKVVIFDAHEDVPLQILSKPYLNRFSAVFLSKLVAVVERAICSRLNGVVAATPFIREKFLRINSFSIDVNNFPKLQDIGEPTSWNEKKKEFCYVGGISLVRGVKEAVKACEFLENDVVFNLAGNFVEADLESEVTAYQGWERVKPWGFVNRTGVRDVLQRSKIGLVTLHPIPNYLDSLPVKMFEYMAAGIPVVASDFPYFKSIVEKIGCGVCVDPLDPKAIAEAVRNILVNDAAAKEMGERGRRAVLEEYNWDVEFPKLDLFYKKILSAAHF